MEAWNRLGTPTRRAASRGTGRPGPARGRARRVRGGCEEGQWARRGAAEVEIGSGEQDGGLGDFADLAEERFTGAAFIQQQEAGLGDQSAGNGAAQFAGGIETVRAGGGGGGELESEIGRA